MQMIEYSKENRDVCLLLHGGGLSPWNYREAAKILSARFRVVLPILDGHAGSDRPFTSVAENAKALLACIDENFGGHITLLGGLSLGAVTALEMLSQRSDAARFAVIESALVLPMKLTAAAVGPSFSLCYPLIRKRWFAKLQFGSLRIDPSLFEDYYADTCRVSLRDLTAFTKANCLYTPKDALALCEAETLVLAGSRERPNIRRSAALLEKRLPRARLELLPGFYHGDLSINHPQLYAEKLLALTGSQRES